ncbi:MAG TPA: GGDEF domain-containing protein [Tepidisphaeraceae bacterium]|jgi:GGDEF domain-containing protein
MVRLTNEHILVVGDRDRRMQAAVAGAMPAAGVTSVQSVFDALAELNAGVYSGVLVNVEPLENRPEAAARSLREAVGDGRLVVYSDPAREPLSKRLLEFGVDEYVIGPSEPAELQQVLGPTRRAGDSEPPPHATPSSPVLCNPVDPLLHLPLTDIVLSAMLEHPQQAIKHIVQSIAERVGPQMKFTLLQPEERVPTAEENRLVLSHPLRGDESNILGTLVLDLAQPADEHAAHQALARVANILGKAQQIDDRQARLQKMAITDDLTGIYNARYFRHFLNRILAKAKARRFPVTLLLFDIDNFKRYNDTYGHGVGDEILRQTATLMKRCSRDHDLVARISGDEFAVVFWEKEGPRQPYDHGSAAAGRLPSTPLQIADRFRKMLGNKDFTEFNALGPTGRGVLTISGGMAIYPYDARTAEELIEAADHALMFGAKKGGKNSIYLVGDDEGHSSIASE